MSLCLRPPDVEGRVGELEVVAKVMALGELGLESRRSFGKVEERRGGC